MPPCPKCVHGWYCDACVEAMVDEAAERVTRAVVEWERLATDDPGAARRWLLGALTPTTTRN